MKILIIAPAESPHTEKWVKGLLNKGVEVILFSVSPIPSIFKGLKNLTLVDFNFNKRTRISWLKLKYILCVFRFLSVIRKESPDIVHAHYISSSGLFTLFVRKISIVLSAWGTDIYDFPRKSIFHRLYIKRVISRAGRVISTSHCMAEETQKYTGKKIDIIPFGVFKDQFFPLVSNKPNNDTITFGIVKFLEKKYGFEDLFFAFSKLIAEMSDINLRLLVVGDGPEQQAIQKMTKDLYIDKHVHFLGRVPNNKVVEIYHQVDIAIYPSIVDESFGVSLVEAGFCALPVICSDAPGFLEVVNDRITGLIVRRESTNELLKAMKQLIIDSKLRYELGQNALEHCTSNYEFSANVISMLNLYKESIHQ